MAKANVLARRIRAYDRRIKEMAHLQTGIVPHRVAAQEETRRIARLRAETAAALDVFLAARKAGPWMGYANADEAAHAGRA
jgi:hypothetical protein